MLTKNVKIDKQFQYTWGANFRVIGKADPQSLSSPWSWKQVTGTIEDLAAHLSNGHPFMPSLLDGNGKRWQSNANHATMLALDIDDGMTIEQALAHSFIQNHCGLAIETTSSKPDHHKFRLIFPLEQPIEGHKDIKLATLYLQSLIGSADRACSDASRFYFGSQGRSPFLLQEVCLPADFLSHARIWVAEIEARKAQERAQRERIRREQQERIISEGKTDLIELIGLANARLGADAFLPYLDHDKQQNGKWRCKPAFRVGSGSKSAFIGESHGVTLYHDPSAGHSLDGFRFFVWQQRGEGFKATGSDFVELAKEYCTLAGIDVPEWSRPEKKSIPTSDPTIYFEDRLAAYLGAKTNIILDNSATGSGKSHFDAELKPADLGVKKIIYVTNDPYNPTIKGFEDWIHMMGRHGGLKTIVNSDGTTRIVRCKPGEPYTIEANCIRFEAVEFLRDANIAGSDSAGVICGTCPMRERCTHASDGVNFLAQRKRGLSADRVICHPESLPDPKEFNYSEVAIVWDDTMPRAVKQINVYQNDVARTIADNPELATVLHPLYKLFGQELPRYGLPTEQIVELSPIDLDPEYLESLTAPDLGKALNPVADQGVDLSDLPADQRRFYSSDVTEGVKKISKQWLADYARVCQGVDGGSLTLNNGTLSITMPDPRLRNIVKAAKINIFQDATTTKSSLALILGIEPNIITVMRQAQAKLTNLELIQIADIGAVSRSYGKDQQRRINAIIKQISSEGRTETIGYKCKDFENYWHRDNRGSNKFLEVENLILVGTPYGNLGAALANYSAMLGKRVTNEDQGFKEWYREQTLAEIIQGVGRVRANRRTDTKLRVFLISDFQMGAEWKQIRAEEVTPLAADKKSNLWNRMIQSGMDLIRDGQKVTQEAIANFIECTQGRVSQLSKEFAGGWESFTRLLILLLDPHSGINNSDPDPDPEVTQTLVEMVESAPPSEIFRELISIFTEVGRDQIIWMLNAISEDTKFEWQMAALALSKKNPPAASKD
jgi:hypothetical protein